MISIFLYGKNTCHICQLNIVLPLEKASEKIKIFFLHFVVVRGKTEDTIPFVYDEYKPFFSLGKNLFQNIRKTILIHGKTIAIFGV